MSRQTLRPRIYVASLSDYNSGYLLGRWIDAAQPAENIHREIQEMLAESKESVAEEWAIHDYECFEGMNIGEYEDIELISDAALLLAVHGEVIAKVVNYLGGLRQLEEAKKWMEERYRGEFESAQEYAESLVDECYSDVLKMLPDFIRYHIDYSGIADDLELGGDIAVLGVSGKVHIFDAL